MNLCYLILVHHKFEQAARLIRRLAGPDVGFVIHIDKKVDAASVDGFKAMIGASIRVVYADRVDARWGTYHQALAVLRGIQAVVSSGIPFDRCVLLSGQDYPIASHPDIVAFFDADHDAEYIEAYPLDLLDPSEHNWTPHYRFRRYHTWVGRRRLTWPWLKRRPPHVPFFHGSTWWALSKGALHHVADSFDKDKALRNYLRTGLLVDEVYVPTLIMNSPFASKVTGANVTFAEWTPSSGAHPKTLTLTDAEQLAASPKIFARKFDASVDHAIMDRLDATHSGASN